MLTVDPANCSEDVRRLNPELGQASEHGAQPKPRKYRNQPTVYKGREYDSIKEAQQAQALDLEKIAGDIIAWWPQVPIDITPEGGAERIIYIADFVVWTRHWGIEVMDTKGFRTKEYKLKRKLFKAKYGRDIVEV